MGETMIIDDDTTTRSIYRFFQYHIPKIELHAHLNGCIRPTTILDLALERQVDLHQISQLLVLPLVTPKQSGSESQQQEQQEQQPQHQQQHSRTLQECFDLFGILPLIITDLVALRRITFETLQDFAIQHHTVYLELRSTPKRLLYHYNNQHHDYHDKTSDTTHDSNSKLATKREYIETILDTIIEFEQTEQERYEAEYKQWENNTSNSSKQCCRQKSRSDRAMFVMTKLPRLPMKCKLIVSIDRSNTLEDARENIDLAISYHQNSRRDDDHYPYSKYQSHVVGIDLGGNPMKNEFQMFQSLLETTRTNYPNLNITIHCGELPIPEIQHERKEEQLSPQIMTSLQKPSTHLQEQNHKNDKHDKNSNNSSDSQPNLYYEAKAMIDFQPNRLGHALLLPPSLQKLLRQYNIPVETCPTSNLMTTSTIKTTSMPHNRTSVKDATSVSKRAVAVPINHHHDHHYWNSTHFESLIERLRHQHQSLSDWLKHNHPVIICTDDPGIFNTTITEEWCLVFFAFFYRKNKNENDKKLNNEIKHDDHETPPFDNTTGHDVDYDRVDHVVCDDCYNNNKEQQDIGHKLIQIHGTEIQHFINTFLSQSMTYCFCESDMKAYLQTMIHQRVSMVLSMFQSA
jgi:adenosine deaminase